MHVLFEDDGQLKAGTVLADHDQSLQVETVSGKRQKVKAANVLLRFAAPGPAETMSNAHALAGELDAGRASSASMISRASITVLRPDPRRLLQSRCCSRRRRCISIAGAKDAIGKRRRTRSKPHLRRWSAKSAKACKRMNGLRRLRDTSCPMRSLPRFRCCSTGRTRIRSSGKRSRAPAMRCGGVPSRSSRPATQFPRRMTII